MKYLCDTLFIFIVALAGIAALPFVLILILIGCVFLGLLYPVLLLSEKYDNWN